MIADFMDRVVAESLKLPTRVWRAAVEGVEGDRPEQRPAHQRRA